MPDNVASLVQRYRLSSAQRLKALGDVMAAQRALEAAETAYNDSLEVERQAKVAVIAEIDKP